MQIENWIRVTGDVTGTKILSDSSAISPSQREGGTYESGETRGEPFSEAFSAFPRAGATARTAWFGSFRKNIEFSTNEATGINDEFSPTRQSPMIFRRVTRHTRRNKFSYYRYPDKVVIQFTLSNSTHTSNRSAQLFQIIATYKPQRMSARVKCPWGNLWFGARFWFCGIS